MTNGWRAVPDPAIMDRMQQSKRVARRIATELVVSCAIWGALWVPGVFNAQMLARLRGEAAAPNISAFIAVRYAILAVLSVLIFEFAIAFPFQKGTRLRAAVAHVAGFAMFASLYAFFRVLAVHHIHGYPAPDPLLQRFVTLLNNQLRNLLLEQLWAYCAVVLVAHVVLYQRAARERELRESELRAQVARQQLQILKLQLHPHFLFNALHGISALMDTDVERARSSIAHFSDLLRTALKRTSIEEIPVRDEIAFIESYLALEKLRLGERLMVTLDVPRELYDATVPTMVLQPLVENAIRHGVEQRRGRRRVDISVSAERERLRISVVNDAGRSASGGAGIGLRNTRARLQALYGSDHELAVIPHDQERFEVLLTIPLRLPAAMEPTS